MIIKPNSKVIEFIITSNMSWNLVFDKSMIYIYIYIYELGLGVGSHYH
jgi:hypothetical protein